MPKAFTMRDSLQRAIHGVIRPTLYQMGGGYDSPSAAAMLGTISWSEGKCCCRDQLERTTGLPGAPGPAFSWYQIELPTFEKMAKRGGPEEWDDLRPQLEPWGLDIWVDAQPEWLLTFSEIGATIAARGLLWSDYWSRSKPLPALDPALAREAADYGASTWRPNPAGRDDWKRRFMEAWPVAVELVQQGFPGA